MPAHVLIANDDEASRRVLRTVLERAGYSVEEANNLETTLARLRAATSPLVVLLDFSYARWNGTAVINASSRNPLLARRHAYILMLLRDETFPLMTAQNVAQMHVKLLAKPFNTDHLLAAVMAAAHKLDVQHGGTLIMTPPQVGEQSPK